MSTFELSGTPAQYIRRRAAEEGLSIDEMVSIVFELGLEALAELEQTKDNLTVEIRIVEAQNV